MNSNQFHLWMGHEDQSPSNNTTFKKPLIMGVLNVTSDSFYDGGRFLSPDKACEHAFRLMAQGADIIDIGGESTKPGAIPVPLDQELNRVLPVIEYIRARSDMCISIDTYKPETMSAAVHAGATMINDIYALRQKGALVMAATLGVPICLMHMKGQPHSMQDNPHYPRGVMRELREFFQERIVACEHAGINKNVLILDPGFGFGKLINNNLQIIRDIEQFKEFKMPLLLGVSRKSTIGTVLGKPVDERLAGSLSLTIYAALKGVGIVRTHDVDETRQALDLIDAIHHPTRELVL